MKIFVAVLLLISSFSPLYGNTIFYLTKIPNLEIYDLNSSNNIKYLIPTGTKPTKTKGLISYLLKINEFDEKKFQSINVACKEPHNTLTI